MHIKKMTQIIENDEDMLENVSHVHEEFGLDLEKQLANLDEGYEKVASEITRHGEDWHRNIEKIINKMKSETSKMKAEHRGILQKHLDEIEQKQALINQSLIDLRKIKESNKVSQTVTYKSKVAEFSNRQPEAEVTLPTFKRNPINHERLYRLFGQITSFLIVKEENKLSQSNDSLEALLDKLEQYYIKDSLNTPRITPLSRTRERSSREFP